MKRRRWPSLSFALAIALLAGLVQPNPASAANSPQGDVARAWPAAMNNYLLANGSIIADNNTDQNPNFLDLASGTCAVPASGCVGTQPTVLYYASDQGTVSTADDTVYFRIRLAADITDNTKGGIVGGTFIVQLATHDSGTNTDTLRAVVGVDGKGSAIDYVYVASAPGTNVVQVYATPFDNTGGQTSSGMRIVAAGDGSGNYFLDFQVPISKITTASGGTITSATPIKMYYGSSAAANLATINKDFMLGNVTTVDFSGLAIVSLSPASLSLSSGAVSASGPNPPNETQTSTYTVTVTATNPGGGQLTSATASIPLPAGVTASSITSTQGSVTGSGTLNWTIGTLQPGASATVTFTASVTPALGTAGTTQTLVNLQSASGSDVPAAATRTATAPAITVGVIGSAPSWTFSFNSQGGTPTPASQTVPNQGTATAPTDPTFAGHTFTGWYTAASGGSLWNFPTALVTANTTVYAHWTLDSHTVTFDSQGGATTPSSQSVSYGGFASTLTAPTRTGYTLDGWYTEASGGSVWTFPSSAVTADITLYAHWTPVSYTVSFNSHGGTAVGSEGVSYGDFATTPTPPPTQTGYTFDGWYTAASGGSLWSFAGTAITGDTTLHAQWTPIDYTVTFDSQGGSEVGDATVPFGGLVTAPTQPTQTGFTFAGWYTAAAPGGSAWAFVSDTIAGDTTLYAHWVPVDYTLSFDSQGGSSVGSQTVAYGSYGSLPTPAPTRTGYTLDGWFIAASAGTLWVFASDAVTGNRTLYAQWTPVDYTVTFDTHGGSTVDPEPVAFGDLVPPVAAPTRAGYTFDGWFTAATGGTLWAFGSAAVTGDLTLHAQWTPLDYTVAFDTHGGSLVGSQTVTNGGKATEPSAPTRTGYSFDGWFDSVSGVTPWDFPGTPITASVIIHAQWTIDTHLVTFSPQGGAIVASQTIAHGGLVSDPGATTRAGYSFDGWYDSPSGGTAWNFTGNPITGPTTIYAQWTIDSYPVTFDSQGGTSVGPQSVNYGGFATEPAPAPTQTGYNFDGWFGAPTGGMAWDFGVDVIASATTIYAQWTPIDYTVTYNTQGGSPVGSASVAYNTYATAPAVPTRVGYTFDGWFDDPSAGAAWDFAGNAITGDVTIWAQWTAEDFGVVFDSQGGTPVAGQTVAYDDYVMEPASDPTRAGHTFAGWYTLVTGGVLWNFALTTVAGPTTIYAQWDPIDYTITFNGQGGSGVGDETVAYGDLVPEPTPDPTLAGYAFDGWFTSAAGGSAWNFGADVVVADGTLYAHWTPVDYTVTFDEQGGSAVGPATVSNGSLVPAPAPPTLPGTTFAGWYTLATGGALWDFGTQTITADTTLYAQWVLNTHTVTFDSQGGSFVAGETLGSATPATEPADPSRYGYVFDAWYDSASGGTAWDFATPVTSDTILYAYWTPAPFLVTFDAQGGTIPAPAFVNYGATASDPGASTLAGYTLLGWYTTPGGSRLWDFATDVVTADTTLYAQWAPTPYSVIFHSQGGSAITTQTVDYGTTALDPGAPAFAGHTFQGWFTDSSAGVLWDFTTATISGDTHLYAHWTGNSYQVTFNSQGGTTVSGQTVAFEGTATEPSPDPTRAGFTFDGWFNASSGGAEWNFVTDTIAGDTTLYAQWTAILYTVSFDTQGGATTPASQTVGYGGTVPDPGIPTRAGYVFTAWHTTFDDGFEWNFATDTIAGDRTLYAQWTPENYTVSFDPQSGAPTPSSQIVANGDLALAPSEPVFAGHTFDGWYTADGGGTLWDFAAHAVSANTTLYAHWSVVTYPVTFDSQGGSSVSGQTVDYGDYASLPAAPTQPGYTFDGWFDSSTLGTPWNFGANAITGATTLYAQWSPVDWTLTFEPQNGDVPTDQSVTHGDITAAPTPPTFAGHTFDGWFTAPSGGSLWDFDADTVTSDTTLYAQWTVITHPVTFESQGGSSVSGQTVAEGGYATEPGAPTQPGFTFDGWFDSPTGGTQWDFTTDPISEPTTLYAYWTPVDWALSSDSQGGSAVAGQSVTNGDTTTAPLDPTFAGHTFTGWYTEGIGGTLWNFLADPVTSNTTLYAQWTLDSYPVTFNSHGGTAVTGQTVDYGDFAAEPLPDPTLAGYTFDGWFTSASGGSLWAFATNSISAATTLHAQWTPIDYAVAFDSGGGSAVSGQTVPFGGTATAPADPTLTGHTFDGWFTAASGGAAWNFGSHTISGDTTIYAQWTPIDYPVTFNTQGGTAIGSETVAYGDHAANPGSPTRVGYDFAGWFDSASGGLTWNFAGTAITGPTTIYAQWTVETHVVSFDSVGGSAVTSQTVNHGDPAAEPVAPTRTGYSFDGWFSAASGGVAWNFPGTAITGVTTIFAHWTLDTFPVSFDSLGGSAVAGQTVGYGGHPTVPTAPTRAGFIFDGWFDSIVGGSAWDFPGTAITSTTTIYAHWVAAAVVLFDSTGGTTVPGQTLPLGGTVTPPTPPSRTGFTFLGWYDAPTGGSLWDLTLGTVDEDLTLYAHWEEIALGETGANSALELWWAALLTALGLGFLLVSRRRKGREEAAPSL